MACILVTGFGPFPAANDNPSGRLVEVLAKRQSLQGLPFKPVFHVLPTLWHETGNTFSQLIAEHQPNLSVHFGYAANAAGFQLEQYAYNDICGSPDADGQQRAKGQIAPGADTRTATPFPLRELVAKLVKAGLPASSSQDPGRYLCNFLYYNALRHQLPALFVHIPALQMGDGLVPSTHIGTTAMTLEEVVTGAKLILAHLAEHQLAILSEQV